MIKKNIAILSLALLLVACGDPSFDASSQKNMKESTARMMEKLTPEDQALLKQSLTKIAIRITVLNPKLSPEELGWEIGKSVDGKTAKQIIESVK